MDAVFYFLHRSASGVLHPVNGVCSLTLLIRLLLVQLLDIAILQKFCRLAGRQHGGFVRPLHFPFGLFFEFRHLSTSFHAKSVKMRLKLELLTKDSPEEKTMVK